MTICKPTFMIMWGYTTDLHKSFWNSVHSLIDSKLCVSSSNVSLCLQLRKLKKMQLWREILFISSPIKESLPKVVMLGCYALIWKEIWGSQMRIFFLPIRKKINLMLMENRFVLFHFCDTCWELQWRRNCTAFKVYHRKNLTTIHILTCQ